MPVAFTSEIISDTWDAAKFRSILSSKLIGIGYRQENASGAELIFSWDAPLSPAPKDRAFLRVLTENPNATTIKIQAWQGDGSSGTTLTNSTSIFTDAISGAAVINYGAAENFPIRWVTFQSGEIAIVAAMRTDSSQGFYALGFLSPSTKASWWPSNCLYGFAPNALDCSRFRCLSGNPFTPGFQDLLFNPEAFALGANPGGSRDIVKRAILCAGNGGGVVGITSSDFGVMAASGLAPLTQTSLDGQTWVNLRGGGWSFAIRIL